MLIFPDLPFAPAACAWVTTPESGFELSLEWATRFGDQITKVCIALPEKLLSAWARGEDLPMEIR